MEEYHIFYGLILLLQGIFYSLLDLLHLKGKIWARLNSEKSLMEEIGWFFLLKDWVWPIQVGQKEGTLFLYLVYNTTFICKRPCSKATYWEMF